MSLTKEPSYETSGANPPARKKSHTGFFILILLAVCALGGGVYYELGQRKAEETQLATSVAERPEAGPPGVTVAHLRVAPGDATLELPAQTSAMVETPVYARVDGYVKQRFAEIGQRVKKGEVLVELETPDLDQQIEQARATVSQSQAALAQMQATVRALQSTAKLAQLTATRIKTLADQGVMSRQDADDKTAAAEAADANEHASEENVRAQQSVIAANEANVRRLMEQKRYSRIEAPFDGIVTSRNQQSSDPGTLISAGSAREIMRISQTQSLRVYLSVPQNYATLIRPGTMAALVVEEQPGRTFPAHVESSTESLDAATRTMQTLLTVDNHQGALLPGMFVKVRMSLDHGPTVLRIPAEALLVRSEGPTAAIVDEEGKVHIQKLQLGRDYGAEVEVLSGLSASDRVILNPTDTTREGMAVTVKERPGKERGENQVPEKSQPAKQTEKHIAKASAPGAGS